MPVYQYVALDAQGMEQQGSMEASDVRGASLALRARALFVVRIEHANQSSGTSLDVGKWIENNRSIPGAAMAQFYRQMSMMLQSGLTLLSALATAKMTTSNQRLVKVIDQLSEDIIGGASLSAAMLKQPSRFQQVTVQLVRTAEASGELDSIVGRIADDLERRMQLFSQLVTALIYPAVVTMASIGVALFLLLGVIPQFATFFAKTGRPLPPVTKSLVDLAAFMESWAWLLALILATAVWAIVVAWRRPPSRLWIDRSLLRVPLIGNFLLLSAMAKFTWSCSLLLKSGVTLLETLRVSALTLGNSALSMAVGQAADEVLGGRDLASGLRNPIFPPLLSQLAAVGEKTGNLDQIMEQLSNFYRDQLDTRIRRMSSLIEPLMILIMGGMVGYVYYAFFQALFSAAG